MLFSRLLCLNALTFTSLSAYYVIGIPFGLWLTFWRDMQLQGLWIGLTISLFYAGTAGAWICVRTDWNREVEKVRARLEADRKHTEGGGEQSQA